MILYIILAIVQKDNDTNNATSKDIVVDAKSYFPIDISIMLNVPTKIIILLINIGFELLISISDSINE
jgi:hypothetical protein